MIRSHRPFFISLLYLFLIASCTRDDTPAEQRALTVFRKAKDARVRGDHRESKRLLRQASALFNGLDKLSERAEIALLLGETYVAAAEFDSARTQLEHARSLYTIVHDKAGIRAAVLALGAFYRTRGEERQAVSLLTDQLRLEKALGDVSGAREISWALIPACREGGDPETEHRLLNELFNDFTAAGDSAMLAKTQFEFGISSRHRRAYTAALQRFQAAIVFARHNNPLLEIEAMMQCAILFDTMERTDDAFRMYSDALLRTDNTRGAERLREEMLLRVANIYIRHHQAGNARRFLNTALRSAIKTKNRLMEAYSLLQLGHCSEQSANAGDEAEKEYAAGAHLLAQIGLPWANAYALMCLGNRALRTERLTDALEYFRNATASLDSSYVMRSEYDVYVDCEKTVYDTNQPSPENALIDLLLRLGKTDEAFLTAERKNRRDMFVVLSGMGISTRNEQLNSALKAFSQTRQNYIGAERQLANAYMMRAESATLAADVQHSLTRNRAEVLERGDSIAFMNKRYRPALMVRDESTAEIQHRVPSGSVLVEYIFTRRSVYAFVIDTNSVAVYQAAGERASILTMMREFMSALKQRNNTSDPKQSLSLDRRIRELSSTLYGVFIRPIEAGVPAGTTLGIVLPPDVPHIPLHALQKGGPNAPFTIDTYPVRYLPGTDREMQPSGSSAARALSSTVAFGNQGTTEWDVEYELSDVKAFSREGRTYYHREATLEVLRREQGSLLHLAMQMQFNAQQPQNSIFVLSAGRGYAAVRYITTGELFSVAPFGTVVFSNLQEQSLHPAIPAVFRMNGSSDIIMTGYVPLRKSKRMFNELFYTSLVAGNTTEVAYRNALLEMKRNAEYAAPHLWAPYVLW